MLLQEYLLQQGQGQPQLGWGLLQESRVQQEQGRAQLGWGWLTHWWGLVMDFEGKPQGQKPQGWQVLLLGLQLWEWELERQPQLWCWP